MVDGHAGHVREARAPAAAAAAVQEALRGAGAAVRFEADEARAAGVSVIIRGRRGRSGRRHWQSVRSSCRPVGAHGLVALSLSPAALLETGSGCRQQQRQHAPGRMTWRRPWQLGDDAFVKLSYDT